MNLLESLKAAKSHLSKSEGDEKNSPICYAITDAFKSRYGYTDMVYCCDLEVKTQLNQARDFIAKKLAALQKEHNLQEACFLASSVQP